MDISAVEKICKLQKTRSTIYHSPSSPSNNGDIVGRQKNAIATIDTQYKFPVIEDDYDYDFHYSSSPILPLASADHGGNVIYIGSLTKTLAPSVRIGYMIAPENFIKEAATCEG